MRGGRLILGGFRRQQTDRALRRQLKNGDGVVAGAAQGFKQRVMLRDSDAADFQRGQGLRAGRCGGRIDACERSLFIDSETQRAVRSQEFAHEAQIRQQFVLRQGQRGLDMMREHDRALLQLRFEKRVDLMFRCAIA